MCPTGRRRWSRSAEYQFTRNCEHDCVGRCPLQAATISLVLCKWCDTLSNVPGRGKSKRSGCPVSVSLEMFGDRWSLLIIRDLMVRAFRTFKEFEESGEGIATNILADRLQKLETTGIITREPEETDRRKVNYRLTEKGIDLAPVLLELLIWGARHEETGAPCALIVKMEKDREQVLAEVRRRWRERDLTPLLPKFGNGSGNRKVTRTEKGVKEQG
jgi:DNA-binding HxlR family transcriptional regulator